MSTYIIKSEDISKYLIKIEVADDWVSYRHPDYSPNSASKAENRFNRAGETAYYLASGYDTAKAEVPNWVERDGYKVARSTIHAFDLATWSSDNDCFEAFLKSKEERGHGLCQEISEQLTGTFGLSCILYNSQPKHSEGKIGYCLAILPLSGNLEGDTFFVKDLDSMGADSCSGLFDKYITPSDINPMQQGF